MGQHIILIGFMGAGKTTVGRRLAALLGRELLDTDQQIERQAGMTMEDFLTDIIDRNREE